MKSKIALAVLALTTSFAVSATDATYTSGSKVSGYMANSVSATAKVDGFNGGTSVSGAGSNGFTNATATTGVIAKTDHNWENGNNAYKQSIDANVTGTTDTKIGGFAYNTSTGNGATGTAASNGWADAGSSANAGGKLYNSNGQTNVSGQIDTGHPINVGRGPDVAMSVNTNQAASAGAVAGGAFDATGHVSVNNNFTKGTIAGAAGDVKNATAYASTSIGTITAFDGFTGTIIKPTIINAGSVATANADGKFSLANVSSGSIVNGSTGKFVGAVAPSAPIK